MSTVIVTGASSGIGRELARAFARRGHELVLTARRADRLHHLADELRDGHGTNAHVLPGDLAAEDGPDRLLDGMRAEGLGADVLVNNAGFGSFGPFHEVSARRDRDQLRVNVVAPTHLAKGLLPGMIRRGRGGILNVASTAAFQPGPRASVYYASKAYLLHLSEALAQEAEGSGVTVTALCPGPTPTEFAGRAGGEGTRLQRLGGILVMDAATVAETGVRAFERGQRVHVPGLANRLGSLLPRLVPRRLAAWGIARVNEPADGRPE